MDEEYAVIVIECIPDFMTRWREKEEKSRNGAFVEFQSFRVVCCVTVHSFRLLIIGRSTPPSSIPEGRKDENILSEPRISLDPPTTSVEGL